MSEPAIEGARVQLPNTYVIGAPKSGTTSLANWLSTHPDLYFCVPKEPFHWAADYPRLRAHYGFESRDSYESLFSGERAARAARRADGSTVYLYSRAAVPAILAHAPDPRFIVAVRDPVDLLISYHRTQLVALNEDEPDFARAWSRSVRGEQPGTDPLDPKLVDYPMVGQLGAAMQRLFALVPREHVHVVVFDDLRADPERTWGSLTQFLGLSAAAAPSFAVHNASTKTYRWPLLRRLAHRPPPLLAAPVRRLRQWSRTSSSPVLAAAKRRAWRPETRPQVSAEVRREVGARLRADVDLLGELLDRDLSRWATVRTR